MTVDDVRREREAREQQAAEIAATIPAGDYYASDNDVVERGGAVVARCASHSDAVMVLLRIDRREPDAYGRTGEVMDCDPCGGRGVEYGETCVTCGGLGWIRSSL